MSHCSGNCASCSGCARELVLTKPEMDFLNTLAQYAFLPVARSMGDLTPVYLEEGEKDEMSLLLRVLEKKGLVSLDYDKPLQGADMAAYAAYPIHGCISLTERGQKVLEMIEYQGVHEDER